MLISGSGGIVGGLALGLVPMTTIARAGLLGAVLVGALLVLLFVPETGLEWVWWAFVLVVGSVGLSLGLAAAALIGRGDRASRGR